IKGKVVVITGGTGVLGSSLASYMLGEGAKVVILGRNPRKLEDQMVQLKKEYDQVLGYAGSVLDRELLEGVGKTILEQWGGVDALINAAGGNLPGATVPEGQSVFDMGMDDFRKVSELNLDGTVLPSLVFGKLMAQKGKGSIVNVSSTAATR